MRPIAPSGDTAAFFEIASTILESENRGNAALVLIESGEIAGEYYSNSNEIVDRDTVFSTASMSKWITANAVMKLVQDDSLDLDDSVTDYLSRWQLPPSEFDNNQVTIRRLLSHTAGFTDGLGFGDFNPEEELPSIEESLIRPRASSNREVKIAIQMQPGTEFIYSGGGYLILQLLIEEVTGLSFEEHMQSTFFDPLSMTRSTYDFIGSVENNAGSYDRDGEAAPLYKYASSAATGFATSSSDLAKYVIAQIPNQDTTGILNQAIIETMREPHGRTLGFDVWGLGTILYSATKGDDFLFGHDGGNDPAINSTARINPENGDAIIVLETGHPSLATNIGSHWVLWQTGYPDVLDTDSTIESTVMPISIGFLLIFLASLYTGFRHNRQV